MGDAKQWKTTLRFLTQSSVFSSWPTMRAPAAFPAAGRPARITTRPVRHIQAHAAPRPGTSPRVGHDPLSVAFIALCRTAYGRLAGWQSPASWTDPDETFAGMTDVSRALLRSKRGDVDAARAAVIAALPRVPPWFRKLFPYSRWGAALNGRITPGAFGWLVGEARVIEIEVDGRPLRSGVEIERCRYLEAAGCAAMCVNMCQQPVQTFFTRELGMPLRMEPDFETGGCVMSFGVAPLEEGADPALKTPCLAGCGTFTDAVGGFVEGSRAAAAGSEWAATPEAGPPCALLQAEGE